MPVVWSDAHRLHGQGGAVWIGRPFPGDELPERAEAIRQRVLAAGGTLVAAAPHPDEAVKRVHDPSLLDFLQSAWRDWESAGYVADDDQPFVVPYIFPHPGLLGKIPPAVPEALSARTGSFAFDTMTPVGRGTWQAARAAVDCALTAAELVVGGVPAAYACTRPPGHHVTRFAYGGSCYLNNAAAAAAHVVAGGAERVAVVDLDAHHGNGTQSIFWDDDRVLTASVHVDPGAGWFPHFLGFAEESRVGNLNLPLLPGTGDGGWLEGVERLAASVDEHAAEALVVALGVDAAAGDSESPLEVTADGFRRAGTILAQLGLPTVVVQEGGYDLASLGELVLAVLSGFEEGRA